MQPTQGNSTVLKSHVADKAAVSQESDVHGRKGEQSMHHIGIGSTNPEKVGNMTGPQGEVVRINGSQLVVKGGNVVDQAEILNRVHMRHRSRVDSKRWEREHAGVLPLSNRGLDLGSPHQVRFVGCSGAFNLWSDLHIIVGAANLVLGTVTALRESFVTANVATFAGITALAGLGVAVSVRSASFPKGFNLA